MSGAPARGNEVFQSRIDRLATQLEDLEHRLEAVRVEEERIRQLEQNLLDASARRIHDFERRLEHEWVALRQLHEEPLKTLERRTMSIIENCLTVVREALALVSSRAQPASAAAVPDERQELTRRPSRATTLLICAILALTVLSGYTLWRLGIKLRETTMRAAAAEVRIAELQQLVEKQTRSTDQTVQRLSAEALTSAVRAERLANVLAASDVRAYPLRGQRTAAAADGQVFFSPSRGVAFSASKLPTTSSNQAYQVWLVTTRGSISLGFVSPDAQGRVGAAFEAPPELSGNVVGFMLSLEPTGGNVKPTGPIVLAS